MDPDHRKFANSAERAVLRACASHQPPTRSEIVAELAAEGVVDPDQQRRILQAGALVATAARDGRVGGRLAQARGLADELAERVWSEHQADDALIDDVADSDERDFGADVHAHVRSGVIRRGAPPTPAPRPEVPWKQ